MDCQDEDVASCWGDIVNLLNLYVKACGLKESWSEIVSVLVFIEVISGHSVLLAGADLVWADL